MILKLFLSSLWNICYTTSINIQFLNIYPYLIIKLSDLYIKTDNLFEM